MLTSTKWKIWTLTKALSTTATPTFTSLVTLFSLSLSIDLQEILISWPNRFLVKSPNRWSNTFSRRKSSLILHVPSWEPSKWQVPTLHSLIATFSWEDRWQFKLSRIMVCPQIQSTISSTPNPLPSRTIKSYFKRRRTLTIKTIWRWHEEARMNICYI